ncbi:bifunctional serine/threonine-protein kinase/formylglycine-generating enzyme family protein [Planctomycetes bacterium K23_9]|uniref:Serine/threonine-protein kinase PknL n=1 Tax=Stieleria marina TaxID=1930275 RepID=A0A517NP35_9BACT|nr:Serine/threonine-protein kinase PknL [Planctomycetes bacterium K23_9]
MNRDDERLGPETWNTPTQDQISYLSTWLGVSNWDGANTTSQLLGGTDSMTLNNLFGVYECLELLERVWPSGDANQFGDRGSQSRVKTGETIDSRYDILAELGSGGYGVVWHGYDRQLQRDVAIKVSHKCMGVAGNRKSAIESLHEARVVAGLQHRNIVRVIDVGSTPRIPFFIVSELVQGENLSELTKAHPLPLLEIIGITAKIADALQHAHDHGVIHRDVKPANILLTDDGEPLLTDFGLAVSQSINGKSFPVAGTPNFMAPEQAAGREHRINHQCDIYSLGVTLYRLVSGKLPYTSSSLSGLLKLIANSRCEPLSHLVDSIPPSLDRILDQAMAKRQSDRYQSASELANDLRKLECELSASTMLGNAVPRVKVVPQGLRSFDQHDSAFFCELLPGVRDTYGFPQSVRFWKHRIEQLEADRGTEVCVLFGPSGCGKSSFVKAGLIPVLSKRIVPIYIEASPSDTEQDVLRKIAKHVAIPDDCTNLAETVRRLCDGTIVPKSAVIASTDAPTEGNSLHRCVLFIDQFEQWLHQRDQRQQSDLISALETCDGQHVMAILMIRDDFWMSVSRLMNRIDIPIVEGGNAAAVDLFDPDHACRVLTLFGQANGDLPIDDRQVTLEQHEFVQLAIEDMQTDSRVVCVRIALFAQMMKGRPWTPAALQQLGGSSGVGIRFLDQTFGDRTSHVNHRTIETQARSVLSALLPDHGADIKGRRRSVSDLQSISQVNGAEFERLLQVLDKELRLITPVDRNSFAQERSAESIAGSDPSDAAQMLGAADYQLAHDFLVPPLREWLHRKQRETPVGRAELCLTERASLWESDPAKRHLPSASESWSIVRLTDSTCWTKSQHEMMCSAGWHYSLRALFVALMAGIVMLVAISVRHWVRTDRFQTVAEAKVERLLTAKTHDLPRLIDDLSEHRFIANSLLRENYLHPRSAGEKLHAALALANTDAVDVDYLTNALLTGTPSQVAVTRQVAADCQIPMQSDLWMSAVDETENSQLLAAASGLAVLSPSDSRWDSIAGRVSDTLVRENPLTVLQWMQMLRPLAPQLTPELARVLTVQSSVYSPAQQDVASAILADFAAFDLPLVLDLLLGAQDWQKPLFDTFARQNGVAKNLVQTRLASLTVEPLTGSDGIKDASRRANLVLIAMKLGMHKDIWSAWQDSADNSVRTEVIGRLRQANVDRHLLIDRVIVEPDDSARSALLLGVGELIADFSKQEASQLSERVMDWFQNHPSPGVHSACRWLVLHRLASSSSQLNVQTKANLIRQIHEIESNLATGQPVGKRRWYITRHGNHTLTIVPGPSEVWVGSTGDTAPSRDPDETRRQRRINRSYAVGQCEVTVEQFQVFWNQKPRLREFYGYPDNYFGDQDSPLSVERINWFVAAEFCNWLSEQEGIAEEQWCFPKNIDRTEGITIPSDYFQRTGYRLLSETEWESAARSGTLTNWHFGSNGQRLDDFAWWAGNANEVIRSPGLLRPNGQGLCDTYGNAMEWVVTGQSIDEQLYDDVLLHPEVKPLGSRILRGGGYSDFRAYARSAYRESYTPDAGGIELGIRIGRTMPKVTIASQ